MSKAGFEPGREPMDYQARSVESASGAGSVSLPNPFPFAAAFEPGQMPVDAFVTGSADLSEDATDFGREMVPTADLFVWGQGLELAPGGDVDSEPAGFAIGEGDVASAHIIF